MRKRCAIIACCVLASTTAHAGGLAWHAPDGCPDDAAVRQAIERRLEAPLDSVALAVAVDITRDATSFTAQVRVSGTDDRTLTSASCDELTDAVAVVVARLATEARAATPPPAPAIVVAQVPPPPIRHVWNAGVRTTAIVGSGNVPSVGGAGELAAWVSWDHAFVELAAARWLTRRASIDASTMAGVDVQLDTLAIRGGGHFGILRVWLGGEVGQLDGTGFGLTTPHGGSGSWRSVGGCGAVGFRLASHVRGVVGLDLEIAIDRVQFALDSGEVIYRSSAVALRGGVGIELDWR